MSGSLSTVMTNSGMRCLVGRRLPRVVISYYPLSSSDVNTKNKLTPQHYFSLHPVLCKRSIQNQPASQSNKANKVVRQRNQLLCDQQPPRRHIISDPTAKRPTQKCDPYGLAGKSLSHTTCLDLISTLEDGWRLVLNNCYDEATIHNHHHSSNGTTATAASALLPTHLQKYYYHPTFHEASKFMSRVALLATNHNHFPHLSIERILVEDWNNFHPLVDDDDAADNLGNDDGHRNHEIKNHNNTDDDIQHGSIEGARMKSKVTKVKGWIFRSTVRCSTYRPPPSPSFFSTNPTTSRSISAQEKSESKFQERVISGLTYHDFHLAMSVDVEANREDVRRWLWSSSSSSSSDANK